MTTHDMLRLQGYTGKIIVVIDDEDDQRPEYESRFEHVEVFCKEAEFQKADGVILGKQKGILYARNACYDIAKKLGVRFFAEVDDDFSALYVRYESEGKSKSYKVENLDLLFNAALQLFDDKRVVATSVLSQGNYIGGIESNGLKKCIRICTSMFFLVTDRRVDFISSMNEDICTCLHYGQTGDLFFGMNGTMYVSEPIANNSMGNGMTDFYKKLGPFARSFIPVIVRPDCIDVTMFNDDFKAGVSWTNAVPKIMNKRWKK